MVAVLRHILVLRRWRTGEEEWGGSGGLCEAFWFLAEEIANTDTFSEKNSSILDYHTECHL